MAKWYEDLIAAHTAVTSAVSHALRLQSERYFVWMEDGANDLVGDDRHMVCAMTGSTDLYSKQEFDPWSVELGESLSNYGISWRLVSVDYEEETGFFHWSWDWEVPDG